MNEHDSERIAGLLEADGLVPALGPDDADVVVLNTCCIRENADNKLYGTLGRLKTAKEQRPGLEIIVSGCLAQNDREELQRRAGHVDVILGTHNVHRAVDLLHQARESGPIMEIWDEALEEAESFPSALAVRREVGHAAWVSIQIGCDNTCTYCIVPSVRGRELSRPFGELVAEVQRLAADGVHEITLLGQNVNSYGRDLTLQRRQDADHDADHGADALIAGAQWAADPARRVRPLFADLLAAVSAVEGIERVRFTSPHPKDLRPETIAAMADNAAVCNHLHLPLQSGSDAILTAMHRGYTAERYLEKLAAARAGIEDLAVSTDIIVGFPGETDADFERTLEVAAEAEFDLAFTFIFSPRDGTVAATYTDRFLDPDLVGRRYSRLHTVTERSALAKHRARIGRIEEVVVEGVSKRNESMLASRTRQNKLLHFASAAPLRPGTRASVLVTDAGAHYLTGELVEVLAAPRHRTRIPVTAG
ncbi:MAG: MiaB/RimO family radical SAM methylthiotransferase [Acidobacteria bacterium]|nr:MiaB/RimO family radical SAM methylthiotransferase [Acidobacteriota bacterium]